jgi:ribonucleoside-diphosphate reductase alpha chain
MTGAGVGVDYSQIRHEGAPISRTGGQATGPVSLMNTINEIGRQVMQGGARRSAIWAGLHWQHPDVMKFVRCKDWPEWLREHKAGDFSIPAPMEFTNISVILDDDFFECYSNGDPWAHTVYWKVIEKMTTTGEPGFSIDTRENAGETLRNACTEVTSSDDSDICNLGSINLARVESLGEMVEVVQLATLFLLAGTVYSDVPHSEIGETREKNRRLGLGVMGVHEWLLMRGKRYEHDNELGRWLEAYSFADVHAAAWADQHNISRPVKTRAIAPTGTIGIIAETTTGIEPIFCTAFKRRYQTGKHTSSYQYVIDPTARRVVEATGCSPGDIEDAYKLSYDVERRVAFQSWVQRYVDHGISSTINLPHPLNPDEQDDFGRMLIRFLPTLRGMTVYPDGARGGQPLEATGYEHAMSQEGVVFEETEERCIGGACGI